MPDLALPGLADAPLEANEKARIDRIYKRLMRFHQRFPERRALTELIFTAFIAELCRKDEWTGRAAADITAKLALDTHFVYEPIEEWLKNIAHVAIGRYGTAYNRARTTPTVAPLPGVRRPTPAEVDDWLRKVARHRQFLRM